jgi:hypothetical protein
VQPAHAPHPDAQQAGTQQADARGET